MKAEEPIPINCPGCGQKIKAVSASYRGRQGRCPACRTTFVVDIPCRLIALGPGVQPVQDTADPESTRLAPSAPPTEATQLSSATPLKVSDPEATRLAGLQPAAAPEPKSPSIEENDPEATRLHAVSPEPAEAAGEATVPLVWRPGDLILDTYRVDAVLGQGAFGTVYKVRHLGWDMDLAVKTPNPEALEAHGAEIFTGEAETWSELGLHPHIVSCYYVRSLGGVPRAFAEFVDGGSLQEMIQAGRVDALGTKLDIAIQFAWGLAYAHGRNLVHKDVKPANVMLTTDGRVKVTDFGLTAAKGASDSGQEMVIGGDRTVLVDGAGCTPAYAAPEQLAGEPVSRAADAWSFGVSVLAMFTGGARWRVGAAAPTILEDLLGAADAADPPMPASLAALLRECFVIAPDQRLRDMEEIADRLITIYREACGNDYPRQSPRQDQARSADSLVNQALSQLDLGQRDRAVALLEEALALEPHHPEATYNLGLLRWRAGEITDMDVIHDLESVRASCPPGQVRQIDFFISKIHLERGDIMAARRILEETAPLTDEITNALATIPSADMYEPTSFGQYEKVLQYLSDGADLIDDQDRAVLFDRSTSTVCLLELDKIPVMDQPDMQVSRIPLFEGMGKITSLARSSARNLAALGYESGFVQVIDLGFNIPVMSIWDGVHPDEKQRFRAGHVCKKLVFSRDGRYLSCFAPEWLIIVDLNHSSTHIFREHSQYGPPVFACSQDMTRLAVSCTFSSPSPGSRPVEKKAIVILDYPSGRCFSHAMNKRICKSLDFSPSGEHLFVCRFPYQQGSPWVVEQYRIGAERLVLEREFDLPPAGMRATSSSLLSADGKLFAISGRNFGNQCFWQIIDLRNNRLRCSLKCEAISKIIHLEELGDGSVSVVELPFRGPFLTRRRIASPRPAPLALCRVTTSEVAVTAQSAFTQAMDAASQFYRQANYADTLAALKRARALNGYERDPSLLSLWWRVGHRMARGACRGSWLARTITAANPDASYRFVCALMDGDQRLLLVHDANDHSAERIDIISGEQDQLPWRVPKTEPIRTRYDDMWGLCCHAYKNGVSVYAPLSGKPLVDGQKNSGTATILDWNPRRLQVLIGSSIVTNRSPMLLDARTGNLLSYAHYCKVTLPEKAAKSDVDGRFLVSLNVWTNIWHLPNEMPDQTDIPLPDHFSTDCLLARPQGDFVVIGAIGGGEGNPLHIMVWQKGTPFPEPTSMAVEFRKGYSLLAALSPDGRFVAVSDRDGTALLVWDVDNTCSITKDVPGMGVNKLMFVRDGSFLLMAGSKDNKGVVKCLALDWDLRLPDRSDLMRARPLIRSFLASCTPRVFSDPLAMNHEPAELEDRFRPREFPCWGRVELMGLQAQLALSGFGEWALDELASQVGALAPESRPSCFAALLSESEKRLTSGRVVTGTRLETVDPIDIYYRFGLHGEETMLAAVFSDPESASGSSLCVLTNRKLRYMSKTNLPISIPFGTMEDIALIRTDHGLTMMMDGESIISGIPPESKNDLLVFAMMIRFVAKRVWGQSVRMPGKRE